MINLNLIPPAKKQELGLLRLYLMIKNLIIIVLFITIITATILLITKIILQNYFNEIVNQNTLTTKYARLFNKDLKEFNQYLKNIEKIQKSYIPWTNFLVKLSALTPNDVSLQSLTIDQNKILLTGRAKTRTGLLELKDKLEHDSMFFNVSVPLDDLLKKEEIDFNVKAEIDLEKIKQL